MSDYYTKPESEALFAPMDHTHDLSTLGGSELDSSRVLMPESVSADFDDAFTVDEGFVSVKNQLVGKAASNHSHSGYAPASHTHSGYAESDHTHTPASIGAAPASHTHDYAEADHTHTPASLGAASSTHSHDQSAVTGLSAALEGKANTGHTHTQTDITGLPAVLGAKADLIDGKVPASQLPSFVDDVVDGTLVNTTTFKNAAGTTVTPESDKIYNDTTANKSYRWSGSQYVAINEGVALGETSATAYRGDRGKTAYDHSQNGDVHVTAAQKNTWDGKSDFSGDYNDLTNKPTIPAAYSHPASHPASMITGLADVATSGNYNDLENKPSIPTTLPANGGNADTVDGKHADDFATSVHSHTPSDIGAAPASHTHSHNDVTNPPMLFGVEYRTNEKWNGEPLYTTLINCGNFADGTNFDTNIPCRYVVRHCGRIGGYSVPFIHYTLENAFSCWVEVSNFNGRIRVTMQGGASVGSLPVHIQVWYTKATN